MTKLQQTSRDVIVGASIVLLVGVNILLSGVSLRLDMSRGQAYSLSASTNRILSSLKKPIEITFFLSDNVPSSFITTKNQVNDLLVEYRRGSSQVTVNYVDPRKQGQEKAQEYGIQEVQFSQLAQDEYAVSSGYFSIGVKAGDQKVAIQRLDPANLEYTITSIIFKLTQPEAVNIGLMGISPALGGMYGTAGQESFTILQQILNQQFTVENIGSESQDIDARTMILLDGQTAPLTDQMADMVSQYLKNVGGI